MNVHVILEISFADKLFVALVAIIVVAGVAFHVVSQGFFRGKRFVADITSVVLTENHNVMCRKKKKSDFFRKVSGRTHYPLFGIQ